MSLLLAPTATPALFLTPAHPRCVASVIIPARNEEASLPATLDALRLQRDLASDPLAHPTYEVLLLLNNCTDRSHAVAEHYQQSHPTFNLHIATQAFPPAQAHVGTARRLLMDQACTRLESLGQAATTAILSTDADTLVAPDWIARTLAHIAAGAEAVGGIIHLLPHDLAALDPGTLAAYRNDRRLQALVASLEHLLDPDPADPCPRHLQHFGASLACTPAVYRRAGGLPPVKPLEDVAFVDALRKVGARLRHAPDVHIHTSARLDGRAEVGLSGQLRHWQRESASGIPHFVDSAAWIEHRFRTLAALRRLNASPSAPNLSDSAYPLPWHEPLLTLHARRLPTPRFLELLDSNRLIAETFPLTHSRHQEILEVCTTLEHLIAAINSPQQFIPL